MPETQMIKPHIANSDEPIQWGEDVIAICGAVVTKAHFETMWDSRALPEEIASFLTSLNSCRKCLMAQLPKRYVYLVVPGEESIHHEAA